MFKNILIVALTIIATLLGIYLFRVVIEFALLVGQIVTCG